MAKIANIFLSGQKRGSISRNPKTDNYNIIGITLSSFKFPLRNNFKFPTQRYGSNDHSCLHSWFREFDFLHYNIACDVLFCHTCQRAVVEGKIHSSKRVNKLNAFCKSVSLQCSYINFMLKCHQIQSQGVNFPRGMPPNPLVLRTIDRLPLFTVCLEL